LSKTTRVLFAVVACAFVVTQAPAQDAAAPSVTVGGGIRGGASWISGDGVDAVGADKSSYGLNDVRLYLNASAYGWLGVEINTETAMEGAGDNGDGDPAALINDVKILDAVAKIGLSDSFNIWVGRFLAPSDRANLSGPYYGNVGNGGPSGSAYYFGGNNGWGRDDGIAVWGNVGGGMNLKYQVGLFDGDLDDDEMFAGRLVLNLWDDEPGYYNASTYYGEKQILAIGLSYQDGTGSGGGPFEDAVELDLLVEKTLDMGTVTLDAAVYDYADVDDSPISIFVGLLLTGDVAIGPISGKPRPYIRYVKDGIAGDELSIGIQHVIDGHKAHLTLEYTDFSDAEVGGVSIGAQFQF